MAALSLSALDLVPLVAGGTSSAALRSSAELARALDPLGYTRLWYAEVMIVTHAFDPDQRLRSYELLAETFALR